MATFKTRLQQSYDHRLRDLVRATGDPNVVAELGVPRSTAVGWLRGELRQVISADVLDMDHVRVVYRNSDDRNRSYFSRLWAPTRL